MKSPPIKYIPGIISLCFVPLLLVFYSNQQIQKQAKRVKQIMFVDTAQTVPSIVNSNEVREVVEDRNFISQKLTGKPFHDIICRAKASACIRKWKVSGNTKMGIHFMLGDSLHIQGIVSILDLLQEEKMTNYLWYRNHIWVYTPHSFTKHNLDKAQPVFVCGTNDESAVMVDTSDSVAHIDAHVIKMVWPLLVAYVILVMSFVVNTFTASAATPGHENRN